MAAVQQLLLGISPASGGVAGQVAYTTPGSYSWTVPAGVTSVCVVCVGGGSGPGGGLAYGNNLVVTPGESISINVGAGSALGTAGSSWFRNSTVLQGGGASFSAGGTPSGSALTGGGTGGLMSDPGSIARSGGGAAGYSGNGGQGGNGSSADFASGGAGSGGGGAGGTNGGSGNPASGGGGVGILGQGANGAGAAYPLGGGGGSGGASGAAGSGSTGGNGGLYGGGAGRGGGADGTGAGGAVRIIWGAGRAFPATNTGDV